MSNIGFYGCVSDEPSTSRVVSNDLESANSSSDGRTHRRQTSEKCSGEESVPIRRWRIYYRRNFAMINYHVLDADDRMIWIALFRVSLTAVPDFTAGFDDLFELNELTFSASVDAVRNSGQAITQLQCNNCQRSGLPASTICSNQGNDRFPPPGSNGRYLRLVLETPFGLRNRISPDS